jgi:hypothetical protein
MYACWAQRSVTEYNRIVRENSFSVFFSNEADGDSYMSRIVTGNEWWIRHFVTQTKETAGGMMASCNFVSRLPLQQGESMANFFFFGGGGVPRCPTINANLFIHTRGIAKVFQKSWFDKNVAVILIWHDDARQQPI